MDIKKQKAYLLLILINISISFFLNNIYFTDNWQYREQGYNISVYGIANNLATKPHQFRLLIPKLIKGLIMVTPRTVVAAIKNQLNHHKLKAENSGTVKNDYIDWGYRNFCRYGAEEGLYNVYHYVLQFIALFFIFIISQKFLLLYEIKTPLLILMPFFYLYSLPWSIGWHQICDIYTILFGLLFLFFIKKGRLPLAFIFLLIGFLNKETTIVNLIAGFFLAFSKRKYLFYSIFFLLIVSIIKSLLMYHYRFNPGGLVEITLWKNLNLLFYLTKSGAGVALPPFFHGLLTFLGFSWLFVFYNFRKRTPELKKMLWTVIAFVVIASYGASFQETRTFFDIIPVLLPNIFKGLESYLDSLAIQLSTED